MNRLLLYYLSNNFSGTKHYLINKVFNNEIVPKFIRNSDVIIDDNKVFCKNDDTKTEQNEKKCDICLFSDIDTALYSNIMSSSKSNIIKKHAKDF